MPRAPKKNAMSNIDAAWRFMEHPTNLMMVSGIMYFEDPVSREKLKTVVEQRLLRYSRFRQKVVDPKRPFKNPAWEEDHDLDLDWHVVEDTLPNPGNYADFQERVNALMSTPLDFDRPLWQIHILNNYYSGNALMIRIHHCIADGIALVSVLLSLTGETPEESLNPAEEAQPEPPQLSTEGNLYRRTGSALTAAARASGKALRKSIRTLSQPSRLYELAKMGTVGAFTAAKLILKTADTQTIFRGPLQVPKLAAWSRGIPLEDVKKIKDATGTTVNDVLLTAMCGGLQRYLAQRGEKTEGLNFRAAVPVNLRPPGKAHELGNHFGLVFLTLPVGITDPMERLMELKKRMDAIKASPEAIVALGILKAVGMTPVEIQRIIVNIFGKKSTCVMTNVPGPREALYLAGKKLGSMMFWVPCSGRLGLGVSILSYAGEVRLGLAVDAGLVPDPNEIIKGFYQSLDEMKGLAEGGQERASAES